MRLLGSGTVVIGGTGDRSTRYIAPTILDNTATGAPIMQEEIFGPLLPVFTYDDIGRAIAMVNELPKPLALYLFSRNKRLQERILRETSSGGGCINDVVIQQTSDTLPFGGVGESGIGAYHGKLSFDTFSHQRSIIRRGFLFDVTAPVPAVQGPSEMDTEALVREEAHIKSEGRYTKEKTLYPQISQMAADF